MNYNWHEKVRSLAMACRYATGHEAPWSAARDPGHVPAHVMPALAGLAQRLGHPVQLGNLPQDCGHCSPGDPTYLGLTESDMATRKGKITIQRGMSPASTARVLGHELGHARARATESAAYKRQLVVGRLFGDAADVQEEGACELGTAAFCQAMDIGTGRFLPRYLGQQFNRARASIEPATLIAAAENAEALWEAVQ